jgi:DNA-binding response OmpR family regulator
LFAAAPRRGPILVVEDRDDVRQGLSQLLELHGFLVFDAADGTHALEHLRSEAGSIALILLDLLLPRRSADGICAPISSPIRDSRTFRR